MEQNKLDEIASAEAARGMPHVGNKPFGPFWGHSYFGKWQTIDYAIRELGIEPGSTVLDVGAGTGWTTVFLAESGFVPTGVDIAPASIEEGVARAARTGVQAGFEVVDMDDFELNRHFDCALVFDALHHSVRPAQVVGRVATHLAPGGWVLFGEPSWLHGISPSARRTSKQLGWIERGVYVRKLKSYCESAGLSNFQRFYEGTAPNRGSARALSYQLARLLGGRVAAAPQMSVWFAAQAPVREPARGGR